MQGAGGAQGEQQGHHQESREVFSAESGHAITLPSNDYVTNAEMVRDGADLVLRAPDGSEIVIQGYFNADPAPVLTSPEGASLTPALVHSFAHDAGAVQYAAAEQSASDAGPVGRIEELHGQATVTHPDGTKEPLSEGSPIHQGDIIETSADGAVNIVFVDETSFAVSKNAKLAIDQYVYDPSTESGETNFSVLRGLFVYTSGLVGRDDPDDVKIETPRGSIGIRGTIVAGDADAGTVTVVEGAIVVHSLTGQEVTLSNQFETAQLGSQGSGVENLGVRSSGDVSSRFGSLSGVLPTFFNTLDRSNANVPSANGENGDNQGQADGAQQPSDAVDGKPAEDGTAPETMLQQPQPDAPQPAPEGPASALPPVPPQNFLQGMDFIPVYMPPPPPGSALAGAALPPPVGMIVGAAPLPPPPPGTTTTDASGTTNAAATTSGTSGSGGTTFVPLVLEIQAGPIPDDVVAGNVVGAVKTSVSFLSVAYTLATNGPFQLVYTAPDRAVIVYTGGATLTDGDVYNFSITARLPDGRQVTQGFSRMVVIPLDDSLDIGSATATNGVHLVASGSGAGVSVARIGDTDHDGLKEIGFIDQGGGTGQVQILEWTGASFAGLTNIVTDVGGPTPDIYEDMILSGLGDINGDGKDDYAVGSPASDPGSAPYAGDFTIFSGVNPGTNQAVLYGSSPDVNGSEGYGTGLSGVRDVNNDGIADVLLSAPYEDGGSSISGAAWLMFGNPNFFSTGTIDPVDVGGSIPGIVINGVSSTDRLGESVSSAGDFNHDGINDFIIGAPGVNGKGAAYILFGQDGTTWSGYNLSTAGNYLKITGTGLAAGSDLGGFVSDLGDFNGDGKSDIVVAATEDTSGGHGKAYVVFGGIGVGTLDVSTLNGTNGFTIDGTNGDGVDILGGGAVGDFNGDGRDDFAVIFGDGAGINDIYIVYGKAGTMPATLTLDDLEDPSIAFNLIWDGQDGESIQIAAAGDITGDGRDDFLIGSDLAGSGSGEAYLVEGRNAVGAPPTVHLNTAGTLAATVAGQSLIGSTGVDTLVAGSFSSVSLRAGAGNDTLLVGNGGLRLADGGAGNDTLGLVSNALVLDFSRTGIARISEIERINFQGIGQTLKLGIEDVFQLLHDSADGTLRIANDAGASGSTLQIDSNDSGSGTLGTALSALGFTTTTPGAYGDAGVTYNAYTNGTYTLLVDQTISNANVI